MTEPARVPTPGVPLRVFLCYRRQDGAWLAEWLYVTLNGATFVDSKGCERTVVVYFDVAAPGVSDWKEFHFPSLQTSHAFILVCSPGVSKDLSQRGSPDWVYRELQWWISHRRAPPIVVDPTGEGHRWLPDPVVRRWPDINRIAVTRDSVVNSQEQPEFKNLVLARIFATLRESEQATVFQDLERLKKLSRRLIVLLSLSVSLLLLAVGAVHFALEAKSKAEQSEIETRIQSERAERQTSIATAQAWKLYRQAIVAKKARGQENEQSAYRTSETVLLALIDQTIRTKEDTDAAIYSIKILQCFGPHRDHAMRIAVEALFRAFEHTTSPQLQGELNELKFVVALDQQGAQRPRNGTSRRCGWMKEIRE